MAKLNRQQYLILAVIILQLISFSHGLPLRSKRYEKVSRFYELINFEKSSEARQKRDQGAATCGYPSCPETEANKLNVHIIAHTHDDVGWLKTVDQYYYGTRKTYSPVGVQYILDSLIPQLLMDRDKRFIYVEMSFFSKWWDEQDDDMKNVVRQLVNEGRLEFINGGWCMNDEATVNYHSTIEQMTLGLKFLNESFGQCAHPKVGWQIDPFGHTNEQASLFAQFGFDGMYFTRIGYEDKYERTASKSLDLIWHGDRALPAQSGSIFTNVFRDGYDAPNGYCFDVLCKDDMIVDNKKSYEYNLEDRGQYMINFIRRYANAKLTNHLLIPFGGDFQYSAAGQNFKSLDKLMKYISENAPDMNIFYSTPSCYQYAIHDVVHDKNIKLPEKYDDFMPYDSSSTVWWSGYFSSRPSVKLVEREVADLLQVSRLVSLSALLEETTTSNAKRRTAKSLLVSPDRVKSHEQECLSSLWEILGDLQHHDAVTGTEKQHVTNDYIRRAYDASKQCASFIGQNARKQMSKLLDKTHSNYERLAASGRKLALDPIYLEETKFCSLNISQCEPLEVPIDACSNQAKLGNINLQSLCSKPSMNQYSSLRRNKSLPKELERKGVLVIAYNPLATSVKDIDLRLPCIGRCDLNKIQVIHLPTNETLKLTRVSTPSGIDALPFRDSLTKYEILFYANIPAIGSTSFVVTDSNEDDVIDEESFVPVVDRRVKRHSDIVDSNSRTTSEEDCDHCEYYTNERYSEIVMPIGFGSRATIDKPHGDPQQPRQSARNKRQSQPSSGGIGTDRVVVKFDMQSGMIIGLKRVSDGSYLNITQKFGIYTPAEDTLGHASGAYIFRPNSTEPNLLHKPITFKMVKRNNGSLIEIHQKWSDWIWQTIRVDGRKNYIEFDYVVGPLPLVSYMGSEVVTRYITNMQNQGVFFTDSNGRQMLPRTKLQSTTPEQLGGSFYPVVSTMVIRSLKAADNSTTNGRTNSSPDKSAEAVAILVDRPQAGTSLNEGNLEFLIHRRLLQDDNFGVGEPLDEPGEDGRGLVTRGRHRLYLKFHDVPSYPAKQDGAREESRQLIDSASQKKTIPRLVKLPRTPRANVTFALEMSALKSANVTTGQPRGVKHVQNETDIYLVHDQLMNDLRQESIKYALKPVLTFDRLRVSASEFVQIMRNTEMAEYSLLNNSIPNNIHLLTMQPWNRKPNELLLRFENLDNPITLTQFPSRPVFKKLLTSYKSMSTSGGSEEQDKEDQCLNSVRPETPVDIEYLFKNIRIVSLEEFNLGANVPLDDDKRLDWTQERNDQRSTCDSLGDKSTTIRLSPRQIRTFLATYEFF